MAKHKKIQDFDLKYALLRNYVDSSLRRSYRHIRYSGKERIPQEGAVIYAPNHTNALMDALVVLAMDRKAKVFVARADIFKNRTLAKIFTFLKIMPIMRLRDGIDEVKKNNKTIEKSVDVLKDKVPFCIFPEGQHQAKYSMQMLSKGIFRIAFQAQALMPDVPLYIVPVGLLYGNFFRFRSTVHVQVGEPINVGEFLAEHEEECAQEQMTAMRTILAERMKSTTLYLPNDENYDAACEICAAAVGEQTEVVKSEQGRLDGLDAKYEANKRTAKYIEQLKESEPEKAERLFALGNKAYKMRMGKKISLASVVAKRPVVSRMMGLLLVLLTLPYCVAMSILSFPIYALSHLVCQKLIKDPAFRNSVRYVLKLVLWPLLMIVYTIVGFVTMPWQWALLAALVTLPAPAVAQDVWRLLRVTVSDIKLLANGKLRDIYKEIREIMFNK